MEEDINYGSVAPPFTVGQYFWSTLQYHHEMDNLLLLKYCQNPEVDPRATLYLFENQDPRVEVLDLNHRVEAQDKTIIHM